MTPQKLFKALTAIRKVPLGAQEQLVFAAIACHPEGVKASDVVEMVKGEKTNTRQIITRLRAKKMVKGEYRGDDRFFALTAAGKKIIDAAIA